jgi:hypothetical protein
MRRSISVTSALAAKRIGMKNPASLGDPRRDRTDAAQLTNDLDVKEIVNLWAGGPQQ